MHGWQSYNILKSRIISEIKKPLRRKLGIYLLWHLFLSGKAQLTTAAYSQLKTKVLDLITTKILERKSFIFFEDYFWSDKRRTRNNGRKDLSVSNPLFPEHVHLF